MNRRKFIVGATAASAAIVAGSFTGIAVADKIVAFGINVGADDYMSFAVYRKFQLDEICRVFRIPAHLLGESIFSAAHRSAA